MSAGERFAVIKATLQEEDNLLRVGTLCEIASVSRSGYYRWLQASAHREAMELQDEADYQLILVAYHHRGYVKGARGIYMRLLHLDPPVVMNLKKIRRLMAKYGLSCPIRKANPYRRLAKAMQTGRVADNLLNREFTLHGPRKVLLTDITYIICQACTCYLSTILDAYTRQILAYVLSDSLEVDFVLDTVLLLVKAHGISLSKETLIHSDQGCHYTSIRFTDLVRDKKLRQSMSRKANCWDNAPQESFFGHMKDEIDVSSCRNFHEVKAVIDDWMDYYNNERYQWQLQKLSPNEYYEFLMSGVYPLKPGKKK